MHKDTGSLQITLERHKYMHTQMQKICYCLLNAHMWTKDVHIDKRDRTHKMKTETYKQTRTHAHTHARTHARTHTHTLARTHAHTHARTHAHTHTHTHTHTHCCLLVDVFAPLAFGYVCTVIMFSTFRKSLLMLWFSSAPSPKPPKIVCVILPNLRKVLINFA